MFETSNTGRVAPPEDRRMWRLLLARLHPDAGGDHDLFAFACAVRDEMTRGKHPEEGTASEDEDRSTESVAPFLRTWQEAMGHWSTTNHDALKSFWTR